MCMDTVMTIDPGLELYHYGVLNQKWGTRRYQNSDGSLTPLGRIHYGVGKASSSARTYSESARKALSKASDSARTYSESAGKYVSKKYNDTKIDILDSLNRKGVLDFLDSKASDPFSAIRSGERPKAAVDFIEDYKSNAFKNVDDAYRKVKRYSSMVAGMRKNEPYVKVEDTSKPWMETFKNGMMGWNHLGDLETGISSKAAPKLTEYLERDSYGGQKIRDVVKYDRPELVGDRIRGNRGIMTVYSSKPLSRIDLDDAIKTATRKFMDDYAEKSGLSGFSWDRPMSFDTIDGRKVNTVIYANGGGVRSTPSPSVEARRIREAEEVRKLFEDTGKLPLIRTEGPYKMTNESPNFIHTFDNVMFDWALHHSLDFADSSEFLMHHGIKDMHWGTRRYQNSDGSLTPLGRIHYGVGKARSVVEKAGRSAKSGMSKTGDAIRKKVKPTNEELQEKYDKAKEKLERKNIKNNIKNLGKKKKISDMTDEEVSQYINRLNNERIARQLELDKATQTQKNKKPKNISDMNDYELANYKRRLQEEREVRALEKDKKQGAVSKIFEEAAKKGLSMATNKLIDKAVDNIFKTEEKVKYSDLFKEAESKLKFDVLTGDKDVAGQAASRLADLRGASSNKRGANRNSTNQPNPEYSFKNDIYGNTSRTADDRAKANSKSARDKEPTVNAHVYNIRNLGGPSQSSKSAQQTTSSKSSKKKTSFNPFGKKKTSTKSASETFRDVINSNSRTNAKTANDFSETASKFSKAANDLIDKHKNDKS